jgi:alkylhydroperoxidase/carboxymuconolactone decarboxylase family protein YurZ
MACIFNLVALLNFTTTCQCHFWSTISVDGFTSQVACTWMIQMTLNGVSQKQKIGHLMGHYMIPHHVSQVIEARNVGQSDLLLPGR